MIVTCEGCETNFHVEDRLIKPSGSKVRCSKCRHVFTAYSPAAIAELEEPLILSDELPSPRTPQEGGGLTEIESKIDALFAQDQPVAGADSSDQEPELLEVDDLLPEDGLSAEPSTAETLSDDLQLDLDFGPDLEKEEVGPDAAAGDDLASLDELGIDLESLEHLDDAAAPIAEASEGAAERAEPELDLDFKALGLESGKEEVSEPAATELEADPAGAATGISAGSAAPEAPAAEQTAGESELDLTDLEAMLEGDLQGLEPKAFEAVEGTELQLETEAATPDIHEEARDFEELDLTPIAGEPILSADSVDAAGGLEAEIDLTPDVQSDAGVEPAPAPPVEPAEDVLDFSDITSILEATPAPAAEDAAELVPEFDLLSEEGQPAAAPSAAPLASEAQEDLMLDIETLLEEGEKAEAPAAQVTADANEELDMDLGVEIAQAAAGDLEIEIEPVDDGVEPPALEAQAAAAAALASSSAAAADDITPAEVPGADAAEATSVLELESATAAAAAAAMVAEAPRRSRVPKLLVVVLGVLVLAVAAIVVPRSLDINIPFLSDLEIPLLGKISQSQPEDTAGNLKMTPLPENLTAEFIDNPNAGRLCVVRGQVRNNYEHPRSAIRVTAKLYTKDKALAKSTTVFAGNVLSNQELASQDMGAIAARLKNKDGANNANVGVKPGRSIPFMAVFDNLPGNLDEYSVEVAGSSK
jgi:predicted Zn finger-like uncharacterized protein